MDITVFNLILWAFFSLKYFPMGNYIDILLFFLIVLISTILLNNLRRLLVNLFKGRIPTFVITGVIFTTCYFDFYILLKYDIQKIGFLNNLILTVIFLTLFFVLSYSINQNKKFVFLTTLFFIIISSSGISTISQDELILRNNRFIESSMPDSVKFKKKPNVYLLGFLAAVPKEILEETLKLEVFPFESGLKKHHFHLFRNVFSEAYPTRNAYHAIFSLNEKRYFNIDKDLYGFSFSGKINSPLLKVFRDNGYEISTLTENYKFGSPGGLYVDHYLVNRQFSVCKDGFLNEFAQRLIFFGACEIRRLPLLTIKKATNVSDYLVSEIKNLKRGNNPQLLIAHLKPPIHAQAINSLSNSDETDKFRENYLKSATTAKNNLDKILNTIYYNDPESIIIVFGDSGLHLSSRVEVFDKSFAVRDHLAVVAGIHQPNPCSSYFSQLTPLGFTTNVQLVSELVACLSNQNSQLAKVYNPTIEFQNSLINLSDYIYQ
jgi:hypothetical protein